MHPVDPVDVADGHLQRARGDDGAALILEDAGYPRDGVGGVGGLADRELVPVLRVEVARLVRPQPGERIADRGGLQALGGHVREIDALTHAGSSSQGGCFQCAGGSPDGALNASPRDRGQALPIRLSVTDFR